MCPPRSGSVVRAVADAGAADGEEVPVLGPVVGLASCSTIDAAVYSKATAEDVCCWPLSVTSTAAFRS